MKGALITLCLVLLSGCEDSPVTDQCMRAELFKQCLATVPAGPISTHNNAWDEVVHECEHAAYYQSIRRTQFVKPECKGV